MKKQIQIQLNCVKFTISLLCMIVIILNKIHQHTDIRLYTYIYICKFIQTFQFTFKSRGIRKVDTTLNGKSDVFKAVDENKRSMIAPSIENDKLYIGGLPEQNR